MSKQTNDQDDAQKTPAEASQSDATSSSSASSAKTANQQQRRGKGSANTSSKPSGQQNSAKGSQSAAQPASTQSTKTDSAANNSAANNSATTKGSAANKDNATASPSAAASGAGTPTDAVPQQGSGGGGSKSGIFAIVLVVVLAVALAFLAWEGWQRLENQQQRLDELAQKTDNSATQADLAELNERLESGEAERNQALESTTNEMQQAFSEYRSEVNDTLDQVLDQLSQEQDADEREWLHAEAAYLLRLANQRLQLERDVEGAAALLRTADSVLNSADNPALTPVRREIASELAALDAVPRVDRTGIYLALNAQQERIATLRLDQEVEEQPVSSNMEEPPTGTFQRQLARFGEELKDLVVVRGHDEAMEVLITPEQESYLRQSLRLILEQSQLAVLKEEQELFEAGIDKALDLLNRYYDTSRSETQGVISRLEEIRQTNVTPELPDISRSQQALAEFIENRYESRGGES